jgi:hypothetical protein
MQLRQIAYDILKTLTKHKITNDTRVSINWLQYKIHEYRAIAIEKKFNETGEINPAWITSIGRVVVTKVNPADDVNVANCNCILGRVTIPQVVGLEGDQGVYRVSSTCGTQKYYPTSLDRFSSFVNGSVRSGFNYYFRVGTYLYLHPFIAEGSIRLIMENPMDSYTMHSEVIASGNLVVGSIYKINSGRITHNYIAYEKDQTFTAVAKTYTGNGLVKLAVEKVLATDEDDYPMDHTLTEFVTMKILTQDFGIEMKSLADTKNDGQDEAIRRQRG